MTFEELSDELNKLVGEKVAYRRIAANSVIIYFFGDPGDESVVSVFIDPDVALSTTRQSGFGQSRFAD